MPQALTDREIRLLGGGGLVAGVIFTPISETGRLVTASDTYATVASWTITAGAVGVLREVSFVTDQLTLTQFRLTIQGVVKWTDRIFQAALTIPFPDTPLLAAQIVLLEAHSDGITTATIDGSISGEERA